MDIGRVWDKMSVATTEGRVKNAFSVLQINRQINVSDMNNKIMYIH